MSSLTCMIVVPLLNEELLLPRFLSSMEAQSSPPDLLVLVDDGSTDGSLELLDAFAATHAWARVLRRPVRPATTDRLVDAPELLAFLWAVEQTPERCDVVAKMDADLELAPKHVEELLLAFEQEPRLGMAGTYLTAVAPDGVERVEPHPAHHVRGPTRFYRRTCLEDIQPLPAVLGWDGADEVRARARGWTTRSIHLSDGRSLHLRPTGSHDGRLRAFARWGTCAYAIGSHPLAVVAGAALRVRQRPRIVGSVAYLLGWASARRRGVARVPLDIRTAARAEQLDRLRKLSRTLDVR